MKSFLERNLRVVLLLVVGIFVSGTALRAGMSLLPNSALDDMLGGTVKAKPSGSPGAPEDMDIDTEFAQEIPLDQLADPNDTTRLDVSTSKHGLMPKLPGDAWLYYNGNGEFSTPVPTPVAYAPQPTPTVPGNAWLYYNGNGGYSTPVPTQAIPPTPVVPPTPTVPGNSWLYYNGAGSYSSPVPTSVIPPTPTIPGNAWVYYNGAGGYSTPVPTPVVPPTPTPGSGGGSSFVAYKTDIPVMTSATAPSGTASASSNYTSNPPWQAMSTDGAYNGWITNTGASLPQYIQYQFASAKTATAYGFRAWYADNYPGRTPTAWTFYGSNDGSSWTTLDTVSGFSPTSSTDTFVFLVDSPASYTYYRLTISANGGNAYTGIGFLRIYAGNTETAVYAAGSKFFVPN